MGRGNPPGVLGKGMCPSRTTTTTRPAPKANSIVVAVTAAVQNGRGELLLIERTDNGLWALPGGAQDIGESVVQASQRPRTPRSWSRVAGAEQWPELASRAWICQCDDLLGSWQDA